MIRPAPEKILVIQTAFLGDLLLAIPLFKQLRKLYPEAEIHLCCRRGLGGLFSHYKLCDVYWEIDKKQGHAFPTELYRQQFSLILSPHESPRSALLALRLKAPVKIGFYQWWNGPFFTHRLRRPMDLPDALRQLSLLAPLSQIFKQRFADPNLKSFLITTDQPLPEWAEMSLEFEGEEPADTAVNILKPKQSRVGLAPGSMWATKRWGNEAFQSLAQELKKAGHQVVLIGSPEEYELCEQVRQGDPEILNLAGKLSLIGVIEFLRSTVSLLVTNDSGAMHMAAASRVPTVSIFGPTVQSFGYRPWQSQVRVLERNLSCRPCSAHGTNTCPLGTHACMKQIPVAEVLEAVRQLYS